MIHNYHTRPGIRAASQWAVAALGSLALAGCAFSMRGTSEAPTTTGSIALPVEVQRPLPSTLAYSDAAKIGQAASAALWQGGDTAGGWTPGGWVNARTGSTGTLKPGAPTAEASDCLPFSTTVTSLGGVHRYDGTVCRASNATAVLKIAENGGGNAL